MYENPTIYKVEDLEERIKNLRVSNNPKPQIKTNTTPHYSANSQVTGIHTYTLKKSATPTGFNNQIHNEKCQRNDFISKLPEDLELLQQTCLKDLSAIELSIPLTFSIIKHAKENALAFPTFYGFLTGEFNNYPTSESSRIILDRTDYGSLKNGVRFPSFISSKNTASIPLFLSNNYSLSLFELSEKYLILDYVLLLVVSPIHHFEIQVLKFKPNVSIVQPAIPKYKIYNTVRFLKGVKSTNKLLFGPIVAAESGGIELSSSGFLTRSLGMWFHESLKYSRSLLSLLSCFPKDKDVDLVLVFIKSDSKMKKATLKTFSFTNNENSSDCLETIDIKEISKNVVEHNYKDVEDSPVMKNSIKPVIFCLKAVQKFSATSKANDQRCKDVELDNYSLISKFSCTQNNTINKVDIKKVNQEESDIKEPRAEYSPAEKVSYSNNLGSNHFKDKSRDRDMGKANNGESIRRLESTHKPKNQLNSNNTIISLLKQQNILLKKQVEQNNAIIAQSLSGNLSQPAFQRQRMPYFKRKANDQTRYIISPSVVHTKNPHSGNRDYTFHYHQYSPKLQSNNKIIKNKAKKSPDILKSVKHISAAIEYIQTPDHDSAFCSKPSQPLFSKYLSSQTLKAVNSIANNEKGIILSKLSNSVFPSPINTIPAVNKNRLYHYSRHSSETTTIYNNNNNNNGGSGSNSSMLSAPTCAFSRSLSSNSSKSSISQLVERISRLEAPPSLKKKSMGMKTSQNTQSANMFQNSLTRANFNSNQPKQSSSNDSKLTPNTLKYLKILQNKDRIKAKDEPK